MMKVEVHRLDHCRSNSTFGLLPLKLLDVPDIMVFCSRAK